MTELVPSSPATPSDAAPPTARDRENARRREAIADRQAQEYRQVLAWAQAAFGVGWLPSHRHFLMTNEAEEQARNTGERPQAAATVYTVKNAAGDRRQFVVRDGRPVEVADHREGFGDLLLEPDPVRTIEVRGEQVHPHRYALCWAPLELYEPKTAEQLAALRASRERGKAARAAKRWAEENPLLAWAEGARQEEEERGR
jgi:hypothetical protein